KRVIAFSTSFRDVTVSSYVTVADPTPTFVTDMPFTSDSEFRIRSAQCPQCIPFMFSFSVVISNLVFSFLNYMETQKREDTVNGKGKKITARIGML
ncbi:MAG: hypothetical protein V3V59_08875, partial [Thermodesulfovibrionales bacterium]